MSVPKSTGAPFERLVAALQRTVDPAAKVTWNEMVEGKSGERRQIDVSVHARVASSRVFIAVECKHYASPVGVELVDGFVGKIADIGANKGIMVTSTGYTSPALRRASEAGIDTCVLRPAEEEDWKAYADSLCFSIGLGGFIFKDMEVQKDDDEWVAASPIEQVVISKRQRRSLDAVLRDGADEPPTWPGMTIAKMFPKGYSLRLLRKGKPVITGVRAKLVPGSGISIDELVRTPDDWVFVQHTPNGVVDELRFFDFVQLSTVAKLFRP